MNLAAVLKPFFRPPDLRPEKQIESELDEEFAFHIEQIERELIECDPAISGEEASRRAQQRFGDIETLKKRCKRIAMEERIVMQRINAILMVIVVLAVIGVSVQVYVTQRYNTLALQEITMQLTNMRVDAAAEARQRGWTSSDARQVQVVPLRNAEARGVRNALAALYDGQDATITVDPRTNSLLIYATPDVLQKILAKLLDLDRPADGARHSQLDVAATTQRVLIEGTVEQPGWYPITLDGATLLQDVVREARPLDPDHVASVRRAGAARATNQYRITDLLSEAGPKIVLRPGDEIRVAESWPDRSTAGGGTADPRRAQTSPPPGLWREVDANDQIIDSGATIDVVDPDDIANLRAQPTARLHLPEHDATLDLTFHTARMPNLEVLSPTDRHQAGGRWLIDSQGRLQINLGTRYDGQTTPYDNMVLTFAPPETE